VKRTPLARKTPLKRTELQRGGELKRTPFKRGPSTLARTPIATVNHIRAAKRRKRDFGPHGDIIIPRLPCAVSFPWFYARSDVLLQEAMTDVFEAPNVFAVLSEPAHAVKSRGAGGRPWDLVPLASALHSEAHTIGVDTFAAKFKVDLPKIAARLWRLSPARIAE